MFKKIFTNYVRFRLERYVKKYFKKHHPTLIVVVGSVGKTTTKNAIATALSSRYRIQLEPNNYNTEISVPLAIMGVKYPPFHLVKKISTWRQVFKAMKTRVKADQGVDVIIQELATDKPGDLAKFSRYLNPDIAVVTSVSPEHMENFPGGLIDVAKEELSVASFSNLTIINSDNVSSDFAQLANTNSITDYGIHSGEYHLEVVGGRPLGGYDVNIYGPELGSNVMKTKAHVLGEHMLRSICAAASIGIRMGIPINELAQSLSAIRPIAGRMNPLRGRRNTTLIDDSYNSSPSAAIAALDTLYQIHATQRIAVLGSMNELGKYSAAEHEAVGKHCNPKFLDYVVTIGDDANHYLANAAQGSGCQVRSYQDPLSAGAFVGKVIKEGGAVLIKGSQNNVYSEEVTKMLLSNISDQDRLVRQSKYWLNKKSDWFYSLNNIDQSILDKE